MPDCMLHNGHNISHSYVSTIFAGMLLFPKLLRLKNATHKPPFCPTLLLPLTQLFFLPKAFITYHNFTLFTPLLYILFIVEGPLEKHVGISLNC